MRALACALVLLPAPAVASSPLWSEAAQVVSTRPGFGAELAVSGDRLAVSALSTDSPAVVVFVRQGESWAEEAVLLPPADPPGEFGRSLALDGDTLVVGDLTRETAYVYRRIGVVWSLQQELHGDTAGSWFGYAAAVRGDWMAVGGDAGGSRLFHRSGDRWSFDHQIAEGGGAVELTDDRLAMIDLFSNLLMVYRLDGERWVLDQSFDSPGSPDGPYLALEVALIRDDLLVSVVDQDLVSGPIHRYRRHDAGWQLDGTLSAPAAGLGVSLAADGDRVVAGAAPLTVWDQGEGPGSAFLFPAGGGPIELQPAEPGARSSHYGIAVALRGDEILVGAPRPDGGVVHIFSNRDEPEPPGDDSEEEPAPEPAGDQTADGSLYGCRAAGGGSGWCALVLLLTLWRAQGRKARRPAE